MNAISEFKSQFPSPADAGASHFLQLKNLLNSSRCTCLTRWVNRARAYDTQKKYQTAYAIRYYAYQKHIEFLEEKKK